jgi:iron complex outermembrane receptor protein
LHFGYARSVVYPGMNVAIFSEVLSTPIVNINPQGWKYLSAELMDHYEIGIAHIFSPVVKTDITAFWDEGRDRYQMYANPLTGAAGRV